MDTVRTTKVERKRWTPRMPGWYTIAILLVALIWWTNPEQITVIIYKMALVALAVIASHIADRTMYSRQADKITMDMPRDNYSAARLLARALIFFAVVEGFTRGM